MFLIIIYWCCLWISLASVAYLFVHLFTKSSKKYSYFFYLWLGYAILTSYLQIVSLFLPLNHYLVMIFWLALTIIGLRKVKISQILVTSQNLLNKYRNLIFFVIFLLFLTAFASSRTVFHYDSYLYQFNMVAWNKNFPIIPGLANLHERLGFNSSFLVVAAFVEFFLEQGMSAFILNGFLLLSLMMHLAYLIDKPIENRQLKFFSLLLLPFLFKIMINGDLSSLSTDLPLFIFSIVLVLAILSRENIFYLIVLSVLIPTIKLSGAVTVIVLMISLFFIKIKTLKEQAAYLFLAVSLGFGYLIRNLIISAYPLFPLAIFSLNLPWKVEQWLPIKTSQSVTGWARYPGPLYLEVLEKPWSFWLPSWWTNIKQALEIKLFFISLLGLLIYILFKKINKKISEKSIFKFYLPLSFSLLGIVYCFFLAPNLRFAAVYFWIFFAIIVIELIEQLIKSKVIQTTLVLLISFYLILAVFIFNNYLNYSDFFKKETALKIKQFPTQTVINQYGFIYNKPSLTDQCGNFLGICVVGMGIEQENRLQYFDINQKTRGFKVVPETN